MNRTEEFVNVNWKDPSGNLWKDRVLESSIPFLISRGAIIVKVRR